MIQALIFFWPLLVQDPPPPAPPPKPQEDQVVTAKRYESELRELSGLLSESLRLLIGDLDDGRYKQALTRDAAVGEHLLHALVDEALMGRVLVDDDHRGACLSDDIGLVDLRARDTER